MRNDEIKSPGMQFRHIGWCNFVRVMQFRQFIFYNLYLYISPGALGFNLEKKVESWNFQEGYLNAHLTPSHKVPKNPRRGKCLPTMAAIATSWVLQYPKILQLLNDCHRKIGLVCILMSWMTESTMKSIIPYLHIILNVKITYGCYYKAQIITDIRM